MKAKTNKMIALGMIVLLCTGLVFAAEQGQNQNRRGQDQEEKPERQVIVAGSPHRTPELAGLPHITLSKKQKETIETIVKNNQEGVVEVNKALTKAKKTYGDAVKTGRPKLIELAAFTLGQAMADKAILDTAIVTDILEVLSERQLEALEEYNKTSKRWMALGKLTPAEEKEGEGKKEEPQKEEPVKDRPQQEKE